MHCTFAGWLGIHVELCAVILLIDSALVFHMLLACLPLEFFYLACTKVKRASVVTFMSVFVWASYFKILCYFNYYVVAKALSGELSCMGTGLVFLL